MNRNENINNSYNDLVNALVQSNLYIIELQEKIIEARKYLLKDIDEAQISFWERTELFKILGDKENE